MNLIDWLNFLIFCWLFSHNLYFQDNSAYSSVANKGARKLGRQVAPASQKMNAAKKFLKKDHSDSNMMVAIRIRPLDQREKGLKDFEIIRTEDKLLVSKISIYFD